MRDLILFLIGNKTFSYSAKSTRKNSYPSNPKKKWKKERKNKNMGKTVTRESKGS